MHVVSIIYKGIELIIIAQGLIKQQNVESVQLRGNSLIFLVK